MDHSGELPLLLAFESMRRYKAKEPALRVLCGPEVEHKLKTHRLDELLSTSYTPVSYFFDGVEYIDWCECLVSCRIESLVQSSGVFYQGLDFGYKGNLGVRRKIISWSSEEKKLRIATHRWRRVRDRTEVTLIESYHKGANSSHLPSKEREPWMMSLVSCSTILINWSNSRKALSSCLKTLIQAFADVRLHQGGSLMIL